MNSTLRKKRNRTSMAHFNQDEVNKISQWLREGELTLEQISVNCQTQFRKKVRIWGLSRLRSDLGIVEIDEESEDLQEVAADLNHYAVTGQAGVDGRGFHFATLFLIEKQTFKLALQNDGASKVSKEDHGRFKDLFRMKLAHDNAQAKKASVEINRKRLELAQQKQTHHELVTEQKRLERQNLSRAPKSNSSNSDQRSALGSAQSKISSDPNPNNVLTFPDPVTEIINSVYGPGGTGKTQSKTTPFPPFHFFHQKAISGNFPSPPIFETTQPAIPKAALV